MCEELTWENVMFNDLCALAIAIAGTAEWPFTSERMAHNVELLESIARSAEDRCSVENTKIA